MSKHQHYWRVKYQRRGGTICAVGMDCKCGSKLSMDKVEELVNSIKPTNKLIEGWRASVNYIMVLMGK